MTVTAQYLLLGDVDGNGITNITDATLIIRHIVDWNRYMAMR